MRIHYNIRRILQNLLALTTIRAAWVGKDFGHLISVREY